MTGSDAVISACGLYRYRLGRCWEAGKSPLAFVMLNPSTADANVDDPTIRRCMGFARDNGFGAIQVLNLFAFRATDPRALKAAPDPVGPDNNAHLTDLVADACFGGWPIVAAWGTHGRLMFRGELAKRLLAPAGENLRCLGRTAEGHPRHPLYVKADQPLEVFA